MEQIYDSRHSGQEVDNAVDAVQTTIPNQLTQIGLELDEVDNRIVDDETDAYRFADTNGNVIAIIDKNGYKAKAYNVCDGNGAVIGVINADFFNNVILKNEVIDSLDSEDTEKPLSAKQGYVLNEKIENLENNVSPIAEAFYDDESGNICFTDKNGNIVMKLSSDGIAAANINICDEDGNIISCIKRNSDGMYVFADGDGNVVMKLFSGGVAAANFNICDEYGKIISYIKRNPDGTYVFADGEGFIAFKIGEDGSIDFAKFGEHLIKSLVELIKENTPEPAAEEVKQIYCWGDSLTMGAGNDQTRNKDKVVASLVARGYTDVFTSKAKIGYPEMMQLLLDSSKYKVTNCGVGGESIHTIAARMGAPYGVIRDSITLPMASGQKVYIGESLASANDRSSRVLPLLQGAGNSVNPCAIEGVECTLSVTFDSGYTNIKYYLERNTNGTRDITFPQYTPILMKGSSMAPKGYASVIWCWANGGHSSTDDLIKKLHKIISSLNNSNYVIIGLHKYTPSVIDEQEAALESEFGDRFFNWRKYVTTNALYDFGITPTTDSDLTAEQIANGVKSDITLMSEGTLPSSLWRYVYGVDGMTTNDSAHMNSAGYMILGYKIIERFKNLGII